MGGLKMPDSLKFRFPAEDAIVVYQALRFTLSSRLARPPRSGSDLESLRRLEYLVHKDPQFEAVRTALRITQEEKNSGTAPPK